MDYTVLISEKLLPLSYVHERIVSSESSKNFFREGYLWGQLLVNQ